MGHPSEHEAFDEAGDPHRIRAGMLDAVKWTIRGTVVVELRGELDIFSAYAVSDLLTTIQHRPRPPHLLLLLKHLAFTDSSGLGVFVGAAKRAKATRTAFALVETPTFLRQVLSMTGLTSMLPDLATPDEAVTWLEDHAAGRAWGG